MESYEFEKQHPSFGTPEEIEKDLKVFVKRLGLEKELKDVEANDKKLLTLYVQTHHRAADWYSKVRDKRRTSREQYAWGRVILLVLIPLGVLGVSLQWDNQVAVTQATILLTGLMAAFRASSEWMENTFAASNFAKAASELKEKLYAFEGAWNGKAFENVALTDDCKTALQEGIDQAREIVRKQREAYFTASAPPSIDIMGALETARTNATALIKNYQSPRLAEVLKKEEENKAQELTRNRIVAEISKLTALMSARDELIVAKEQELASSNDDARKGVLKTFIATLREAQQGTETSLIVKTSELAAL